MCTNIYAFIHVPNLLNHIWNAEGRKSIVLIANKPTRQIQTNIYLSQFQLVFPSVTSISKIPVDFAFMATVKNIQHRIGKIYTMTNHKHYALGSLINYRNKIQMSMSIILSPMAWYCMPVFFFSFIMYNLNFCRIKSVDGVAVYLIGVPVRLNILMHTKIRWPLFVSCSSSIIIIIMVCYAHTN